MSYAKVLAKNAPPEERQAHPDTSLLTTAEDVAHAAPTVAPEDLTAEKAHVVDRDDFEKLRDAVEHADQVQPDHFAEAAEHRAERDQARLKAQAQAELKRTTDKVDATAEEAGRKGENVAKEAADKGKAVADEAADKGERLAKDAANKGQEIADETKAAAESGKKKAAEVYREGKQEAKELYSEGKKNAEQAWSEGKKDAKEIASKLEREGKAEAKKLQRKASELEREGRDLAKRYPYAASGIVGIANALLVAVPAYYAYANWHHPRWDKRIVSAVAVGLGAIFSAEGALGWFEYKQEHPRA
ncbi:Proteophosphoglycan ppg1 [Rhodotorula sp. JG-1b]|nr:Proteophosphoglycan ppg1 [Rhodotorula sp. JG-1b]